MTSGLNRGRACLAAGMAALIVTLAAAPCTAGQKKSKPSARQPAKRKAVARPARAKKSTKRASPLPARWHPGLELAYRMADGRVVKR